MNSTSCVISYVTLSAFFFLAMDTPVSRKTVRSCKYSFLHSSFNSLSSNHLPKHAINTVFSGLHFMGNNQGYSSVHFK